MKHSQASGIILKIPKESKVEDLTSNLRKRFKDASGSGGSNQTCYYAPISVLHIEGHENARLAQEAVRH